ncbi:GNAT family N-acetyltransferase [Brevibacillus gelatini]|uniref:GNAT family N-acetyltransferase n=1 Tax=Brevibacillus gelatini TaxID=1655277 RepID=UPI003D8178AF
MEWSIMYKLVDTAESLALFHEIKESVWTSMGFEMEYAKDGSDVYLLMSDGDEPGGTFEFTPHEKSSDYLKNLFQDVLTSEMKVVEVDSFAVLPKFRGKLGRWGIALMMDYAEKHGYTHAVGLSDPAFFQLINNKYNVRATQVKEIVFYKGANAIPTVFHLQEAYLNKHKPEFAWYQALCKQIKVEVG